MLAKARRALSSIASSTAGSGSPSPGRALRYAASLDVLPERRRSPRLRRQHTTRSLDAEPEPVATLTRPGDPVFNGAVIGILADPRQEEDSPLLRKCSLYNKPAKRKVHDSNYIEFYKKWRSLENVADAAEARKLPRLALRSWLLGIFAGAGRSSTPSLRRAPGPPLLDTESAV